MYEVYQKILILFKRKVPLFLIILKIIIKKIDQKQKL